jgi:stigma-specific protein Stig1
VRIALFALLLAGCVGHPCLYICGTDGDCPTGWYCESHQCLQQCILCGGACVQDTFHNCEACGVACADGQKCSSGRCAAVCGSGLTDCLGSCYDLQGDRLNCGGCGHVCASDQVCHSGTCVSLSACQ